jgi:hypothetical protein
MSRIARIGFSRVMSRSTTDGSSSVREVIPSQEDGHLPSTHVLISAVGAQTITVA